MFAKADRPPDFPEKPRAFSPEIAFQERKILTRNRVIVTVCELSI
jgi:hypothetical protein